MTKVYGPLRRTYRSRSLGLLRGSEQSAIRRAIKTRSGSASLAETQLVYLIGEGEASTRRGRGFADRLDGAAHTGEGITDRNQLATLHALFSYAPQTTWGCRLGQPCVVIPLLQEHRKTSPPAIPVGALRLRS